MFATQSSSSIRVRLALALGLAALVGGACAAPRDEKPGNDVNVGRPDAGRSDVMMLPDIAPQPGPEPAPGPEPTASPAACDPGFHSCGGVCKSDMQITNCGVACDPCPQIQGGETTCDGKTCGVKCPTGMKPCDDKCVADNAVCAGCPAGKNACNGICVLPTDTTACGASCTPCPSSPNGKAECVADQCRLTCNPGFHLCGTQCLPDISPDSCGASCTPCMKPQGGAAECVNGTCKPTCPAGTTLCPSTSACIPTGTPCNGECPAGKHACSNVCIADSDVNGCGVSCQTCGVPANGSAVCNGGTCGFRCNSGFHACGNQCKSNSDAKACGESCTVCPAPPNARPICSGGRCDWECTSGKRCGDSCQQCCVDNDCPKRANQTASCNSGSCNYVDNCIAGQPCAADNACQIFRTACSGGTSSCMAMNRPPGTPCGTGSNAGTCQGGSCVSFCAGIDCGPNGTCTGGNCQCRNGFTGSRCQNAPDPCANVSCGPNATCAQGACVCKNGFTGPPQCQTCNGMLCGNQCKEQVMTCFALIRSQTADPCRAAAAGLACNAPSFDYPCNIGVIVRRYLPAGSSCSDSVLNTLGVDGCRDYLAKNRQGPPHPPLDRNLPIVVSFGRETIDSSGSVAGAAPLRDSDCRTLGVSY
jgi:hypothetical protein